jgi:glutamate-5-semialdehyde dehydrogenase
MANLECAEERDAGAIADIMAAIGHGARKASHALSSALAETKNLALRNAAASIHTRAENILTANARDVAAAKAGGAASAFLDRLYLDSSRVEAMARGLDAIAGLPDPVQTGF